jgi:UDP-2,4-diacetamido-2,4,6-trideoxy-beta-L-altropyranose hydrolase
MKVGFRVDAGIAIGAGHLSRCLTIANALKLDGVSECFFILKSHEGSFTASIYKNGFSLEVLPLEFQPNYYADDYEQWVGGCALNDAKLTLDYLKKQGFTSDDWLIIDHYGLDHKFETIIVDKGINVGVIDDLANRQHNCKFLVDQTCGRRAQEYKNLVNFDTDLMTGQFFCMLRPEFLMFRERALAKRTKFKGITNIFINFGSTDPTNVTSTIIDTLNDINFQSEIELVIAVGGNSPNLSQIKNSVKCFSGLAALIIDAQNMSELMYNADVAIGAAGATTWERCALGLPSIIIKTAENQSTVIERILDFDVAVLHDMELKEQPNELLKHLSYIQDNYQSISEKCSSLVTADGVNKVIEIMLWKNIK